jgi:hypothetical protein
LRQRRAIEEFLARLDAAEAEGREKGAVPADEVHARIRAQLLAE